MIRSCARATAAELAKLSGLPAALAAVFGTIGTAVAITGALAASPVGANEPVAVVLQAVPYLQAGTITLGVLAVGTEYADGQLHTTLRCVPDRLVVPAAKALAYLAWAAGTAVAALAVGLLTARIALATRDVPVVTDGLPWNVVGAAAYLALIGLLGFALAALLRAVVSALVVTLSLVLVVSPVLDAVTPHARYLPDRAGGLLYLPDQAQVLTPATGLLVLLGWVVVLASGALAAFRRRDA
ncbi:ABC transporter permease [Verrucosispora sioxanthis]|uniref:ABC transporter permease n=1 Tax=Verrucosispora sioxanthis TaxID=2499994 RepID=A0A6M1KV15_9ACTN|nr:ABC transporter permease [Verrucosispora sioxanthis]NEE62082.1 ABC transporter permease [Verrucosispora sioxanthis]NGM11192.1 ABC transporter permease [Verrucosispora sioxanthis]